MATWEFAMDAPIFIMGTPRSGTTLTARILGRHSRLFMPGEAHFFEDIFSRRRELGDLGSSACRNMILERLATLYGRFNEPNDQERIERLLCDPSVRRDLESSCGSYKDLLSTFMEVQARSEGKARWGNNAPRDLFSVNEILSFYPDAKILLCIRDVRDFLISYRDKWRATSTESVERLKLLYHPVVTSLLWKSSAREISGLPARLPSADFMLIRYEELVRRPEPTVRKICEFVGESFEPGMLEVDSNNSSAGTRQGGIYASSVGRWRDGLAEEDAHVAQLLTRKELERLGYSVEKTNANPVKVAATFLSTPFAFWRAIEANKEKRGPLIPYVIRRATPFLRRKGF